MKTRMLKVAMIGAMFIAPALASAQQNETKQQQEQKVDKIACKMQAICNAAQMQFYLSNPTGPQQASFAEKQQDCWTEACKLLEQSDDSTIVFQKVCQEYQQSLRKFVDNQTLRRQATLRQRENNGLSGTLRPQQASSKNQNEYDRLLQINGAVCQALSGHALYTTYSEKDRKEAADVGAKMMNSAHEQTKIQESDSPQIEQLAKNARKVIAALASTQINQR